MTNGYLETFVCLHDGPRPSVGAVFNASLDGLLTGLSLIVAIGAQNAYVLRQGLRRAYVGPSWRCAGV